MEGMDLAALIAAHQGDRSYDRLSRDCGGIPTGQRLHQLATSQIKDYPAAPTIRGLARGLSVSQTTVVLACARSLGLEVRSGEDQGVDLEGLTSRQADAIRGVVRAMLEPEREDARERPTITPATPEVEVVADLDASGQGRVRGRPAKDRTKGGRVGRENTPSHSGVV